MGDLPIFEDAPSALLLLGWGFSFPVEFRLLRRSRPPPTGRSSVLDDAPRIRLPAVEQVFRPAKITRRAVIGWDGIFSTRAVDRSLAVVAGTRNLALDAEVCDSDHGWVRQAKADFEMVLCMPVLEHGSGVGDRWHGGRECLMFALL